MRVFFPLKMKKADFHISSNHSNGLDSIEFLINLAFSRQTNYLSITDQDSISGLEEAAELSREKGITFIPGVELSTHILYTNLQGQEVKREIHLLGYNFDINNPELNERLSEMRTAKILRFLKVGKRLNEMLTKDGYSSVPEEVLLRLSSGIGTPGRDMLARWLHQNGIASNEGEAFTKWLKSIQIPKITLPFEDAAKLIRGAGGFTSLAHPLYGFASFMPLIYEDSGYTGDMKLPEIPELLLHHHFVDLLDPYLPYIDGMGVFYSGQSDLRTNVSKEVAIQNEKVITGGGDHRGIQTKYDKLGLVDIPEKYIDAFLLECGILTGH
jgi:3',5'-nucleoside bisphosphate phosphatase